MGSFSTLSALTKACQRALALATGARPLLVMDGILLVDKPIGITSAEVVRRIKKHVRPARVGHLGTLDPLAEGLLPIMVGEATKLAPFLSEADKEYEGTIKLGEETDTLDRTGQVVKSLPVPSLDQASLARVAARFIGTTEQVPPLISAIKRKGVALYKRVRRGEEVEPPPARKVEIRSLKLEQVGEDLVRFATVCSTGTYLRAVARDIGHALGTVAHLYELRRLRSGGFSIRDARSLSETLRALESGGPIELIGLRKALPTLAEVEIDASEQRRLRNGDARALLALGPYAPGLFKIICSGRLVGVADADTRLTARIMRIFGADADPG